MKNIQCIGMVIGIMLLGFAGQAFAHATPVSYEPESSSILSQVPQRVDIRFSERIEPVASDISILGPDGNIVTTSMPAVALNDSRLFGAGLRDAGRGTYTVIWDVVSADDGHFTKGAFTFSVGEKTAAVTQAAGQIQIQHITTIPQATVMWIELMGQSLLLGALLMLGIWRSVSRRAEKEISGDVSDSVGRRITAFVIIGIAGILAGVISLLILKTFDLQELKGAGFIPTLRIFISTLDGMHAVVRALLAVLFAAVFFFFRSGPETKKISKRDTVSYRSCDSSVALMLVMCGIAMSRARVSHSAATNFFPVMSIAITALQLLAKELWVGGTFAIAAIALPIMLKKRQWISAARALTLFSKIISITFGVVGITGAYIVWLDLKKPAYLFASEWGGRFIILLIFGLLLFCVRIVSQLIIEKKITASGESPSAALPRLLSWSHYAFCFEAIIGAALLFATSFLIITTPPYPPTSFLFEKHMQIQGADISLGVHPYEPDQMLVTVSDEKNNASVADVVVRITNEEKGILFLTVPSTERFPGGYTFPRNSFSLPGVWQVAIAAHRSGAFDAVASFTVNYPSEIDVTRVDPERRSFGLFEMLLIISVLGISGVAFLLYRFSNRLHNELMNRADALVADLIPATRSFLHWSVAVGGLIVVSVLIWFSYATLVKTDFQKQCERDGNFWLQAVPMRDGAALSSDTVTGCTVNVGLYHFPDSREYTFFTRPRQSAAEVIASPIKPVAGMPTDLSVRLSRVERGQNTGPIEDLGIYHDRILHMIIVGEDLKTFAHIHTEDIGPLTEQMKKDGVFPLRYTFPLAGRYAIVIHYVQAGKELSQESFIDVGGNPQMKKNADAAAELSASRSTAGDFDGYHVTLQTPSRITAGTMEKLTYVVEKDGKELTDMQPYLGAAMHLAVVRADLGGRVMHTHGQSYLPGSAFFQQLFQNYVNYHSHFVPDHFGPKIQARIAFPQPGLYQIFGEFKHGGKVITSRFAVQVE